MDTSPTPSSSTGEPAKTTDAAPTTNNTTTSQSEPRYTRPTTQCDTRWIIGNTAPCHYCRNPCDFAEGTWKMLREPIFVNGSSLLAASSGIVQFKLPSGRVFEIEALFVPFIQNSLLSIARLSAEGRFDFIEGTCMMDGEVFGNGQFYVTAEVLRPTKPT